MILFMHGAVRRSLPRWLRLEGAANAEPSSIWLTRRYHRDLDCAADIYVRLDRAATA